MDRLDHQTLSAAQQTGFPGLWEKADLEESEYIINNGILYSIWTSSSMSPKYPRIMLPPEFQEAVIDRAHVWPRMRETIMAGLTKCGICLVHQKCQDHVAMGDMPLPASPMQVVAIDLIGPFVASSRNNRYVSTIIHHCSGWAQAYQYQINVARLLSTLPQLLRWRSWVP